MSGMTEIDEKPFMPPSDGARAAKWRRSFTRDATITTLAKLRKTEKTGFIVNPARWAEFVLPLNNMSCLLRFTGARMAREDAVLALGADGSLGVFQETGAVAQCPNHPEIFVRAGDAEAEQRAYALAETRLSHLPPDERQAATDSMAASLAGTADRRCPLCV
jgi:hypothetical protein